ncbi:hypothetical protein PGTUg99_011705 [Puccinia graminis f. sp. tritici]|uniref:Uncharacterized protein n=1 Tax=Puccinia graminis f. sp. tritici TaxID=56615 RepID=A0A5B0NSH7_PUCGR|nr:hypothetical protein PGTUg99_011705 [Puccinia graminis f. sp. tritici]
MRVLLSFQLDHSALLQGVLQGFISVQLVMSLSSEMNHNGWEEEVPLGHATEAANGVHPSGWLPIARHVSFISRHLPLIATTARSPESRHLRADPDGDGDAPEKIRLAAAASLRSVIGSPIRDASVFNF